MISEDKNIAVLKQWMAFYSIPEYADEYVKVLHYVLASYDDDDVTEAVAYLRDRYEPGWQPAPPRRQQQTVTAPADERHTVHGVPVVLRSRAFRHIPPSLWEDFRDIMRTGSFAKKVSDAGDKISGWTDVTSTSDESFTFGDKNAAIRTVASWSSGELDVYHAHPDMPDYGTYF